MGNYIRRNCPGGTYFFTVRLQDRNNDMLTRHVHVLRHAFRDTMTTHPFKINAIVVLPAIIHTIWTLPDDDSDFSRRWTLIKTKFSRQMPVPVHRTASQIRRQERGIWQRRFWEHLIRSKDDFATHEEMIYSAPVAAGLVARPQDYAWSSLHRNRFARVEMPKPSHHSLDTPARKVQPRRTQTAALTLLERDDPAVARTTLGSHRQTPQKDGATLDLDQRGTLDATEPTE